MCVILFSLLSRVRKLFVKEILTQISRVSPPFPRKEHRARVSPTRKALFFTKVSNVSLTEHISFGFFDTSKSSYFTWGTNDPVRTLPHPNSRKRFCERLRPRARTYNTPFCPRREGTFTGWNLRDRERAIDTERSRKSRSILEWKGRVGGNGRGT